MKDRQPRKTEIDVIGDVPWGTHLCLFYHTKQDLIDILVPYFKAGLENNEFCMWVTSEPLLVEEAKKSLKRVVENLDDYIEKGQIEILDYSQWYTKSGRFDADEVLQGWVEKEAQALERGFDGLCLTGNTFWLGEEDWEAFTDYEAAIDGVIGEYQMTAICTYSLDRCGASEVIDVVSNHEFALVKREGKWDIIESAERKRAEEMVRRQRDELAARAPILSATLRTMDLDELLDITLNEVLAFLQVEFGSVHLVQGDEVVLRSWRGLSDTFRAHVLSFPADDPPVWMRELRVVHERLSEQGLTPDFAKYDGIQAWVGIPLCLPAPREGEEGEWLGTILVGSRRCEALNEDRVRVLEIMADQLALAIDHARTYRQAQERLIRLQTLRDIDRAIIQQLDLREVLHVVLERVPKELNADAAAISLLEEGRLYPKVFAMRLRNGTFVEEEVFTLTENLLHWLLERQEPVIIYDLTQDPRVQMHRERIRNDRLISYLGVPLIVRDKTIGILHIMTTQPKVFASEDVAFFRTMAGQTAIAIENVRLYEVAQQEITERKRAEEELRQAYENSLRKQEAILNLTEDLKNEIAERKRVEEELQQRTAQLEALRQVGLEIAAELDLDPLLHSIVSQAVELVGGTAGGLYLYRPDLDVLGWVMAVGPHMPPLGTVLRRGEGFSGKVWETGEPLMVDDYQQWEGRAPIYEDYPWTAVVGVPVHWGEKFLGVLNVLADAPHTFSLADAEMLSLFATQAAIAIRNACLFDGEQEQRELAEALEEAAAAVSSTLDLDEVLDRILEQTEQVVDGDAFSVILIEDDIARLARYRGYELPGEETLPSRFDIPINDYSILMKMVRMGESVVVADTSLDPDWVPAERDEGWRRSYVGVPIRLGGATAGFLGVSGTRPGQFGPKDVRMVEALASHAAAAIENARLHEDTQQKTEELELLLDTATAVSSTLEPDRVLRSVAEKMTTSVGVAFCRIALLDENSQTLTIRAAFAVHDLDWDPGLGRQYTLADAPWHRQAIERGQIMTLRQDDPSQAASETECRMALSEGIQSALLIPLVIGNRVLGVVSLGEMRSWGRLPFTADRVRLCQAMANQTAVAIRNAQLLNAGMEHRRDLQRLSTQLINAQEGERRRLSRELHDEMGQALTMMRISLVKIWEELPPQVTATLKRRLTEASSLAEQTLEQVRELSLDLRPTMLDDFGLVSALRWYLDRYAKRLDIEVAFEAIDLEDRLPAEMETALYRVAQEALTNVARHAQANKVHLRVERKEASVAALIEDDGRGFEVEKMGDSQAPERGIGLLGIRERVTFLGGNFDIQSRPGEGTRLTIEIPV